MMQQRFFHILTLLCVTFVISFLIFKNGFPIGYDYKNQIISYEAVSAQIRGGEIYPRWLADVNKGYGSTNLFFYPPFTYYTAFFIDTVSGFTLSTSMILSLNASLLVFLSGLSFFVFARGLTTPAFGLLASILYITLPYHTWFEIYERNALAELSSYIWLPLIFHCIRSDLFKTPQYTAGLSLSYALLILSHLPTAVFSSIFIVLYSFLTMIKIENNHERIRFGIRFIACLAFGAGLSGIYLYPAISLLEKTNSAYLWEGFYDYQNWFLWLNSDCPIADACANLFLIACVQIIIPIAFFILLVTKDKTSYMKTQSIQFFILAVFCFFLMTPFSSGLWNILWPLQKIQFPWRLMVVSDFLFASILLTTIYGIHISTAHKKPALYILSGLTIFSMFALTVTVAIYAKNSWAPPMHKFEDSIANKMLTEEHIPKNKNLTLTYKELQQSGSNPLWTVPFGQADIELISQKPRIIKLRVQAQENVTLQIRQFYFMGWRVFQDESDQTEAVKLRDAKPYGQLEMDLPKGQYDLTIKLEALPQEKIGAYISAFSLLLLLIYILTGTCLTHKKRKP